MHAPCRYQVLEKRYLPAAWRVIHGAGHLVVNYTLLHTASNTWAVRLWDAFTVPILYNARLHRGSSVRSGPEKHQGNREILYISSLRAAMMRFGFRPIHRGGRRGDFAWKKPAYLKELSTFGPAGILFDGTENGGN